MFLKCKKILNTIPRFANVCFLLQLQWLLSCLVISEISLNKVAKHIPLPVLPPGSRNGQLIYPKKEKQRSSLE
jgi:hypothetical protein